MQRLDTELAMIQADERALLAVLAHPDDETFGMGGTLALYARKGVAIYLVCATRGEVGEVEPQFMEGFQSVADRRETELRCAAGILGLRGVRFLNYRDSGMAGSEDNQHPLALVNQPINAVAAEVVQSIREIRPQIVLTFDPIGGYRHPDHIAIHLATRRGFELAGDPAYSGCKIPPYQPQKLYYQTIPRDFLRWIVRFFVLLGRDPHHLGKNKDIDLQSIVDVDFPIDAVIDYHKVGAIRDQAAACHASQGGASLTPGILGHLRRWLASREVYMRAYPPPVKGKVEKDLFEGVS